MKVSQHIHHAYVHCVSSFNKLLSLAHMAMECHTLQARQSMTVHASVSYTCHADGQCSALLQYR